MSGRNKSILTDYYQPGTTPLLEYPRPNFQRSSYVNLNGEWDYAFSSQIIVDNYDGKIVVPFSPESKLSGVNRSLAPNQYLFYRRHVRMNEDFHQGHLILHFGAIDQEAEIYINDFLVATYVTPYLPIAIEITKYVSGLEFEIRLRVKDVTTKGAHLTGKQQEKRGGIWYTPQSGIWQTVWLESTPNNYLKEVEIAPLFDDKTVHFNILKTGQGTTKVSVYFQSKLICEGSTSGNTLSFSVADDFYPWSPDQPNIYEVEYQFGLDKVRSYFGFRKVERKLDKDGYSRFYLNNQPMFQSGVLDQGYYSDGLLTPPSDQAMIDDIKLLKSMGFNMLRKHIKVEPLRFYYHCDCLGILVWQDMINLTPPKNYNHNAINSMFFNRHPNDQNTTKFGVFSKAQKDVYYVSLEVMIQHLKPFLSIVTWVPFNEGWGQFDSEIAANMIKKYDQTRLIDHASGWSDQNIGDYYSRHIYFTTLAIKKRDVKNRIIAISEFGGYSLGVADHMFDSNTSFGYRKYRSREKLQTAFEKLYVHQVMKLLPKGLSAIIYTQLSDVEDEVNGLVTYDRKVVKFNIERVNNINQSLYKMFETIYLYNKNT